MLYWKIAFKTIIIYVLGRQTIFAMQQKQKQYHETKSFPTYLIQNIFFLDTVFASTNQLKSTNNYAKQKKIFISFSILIKILKQVPK